MNFRRIIIFVVLASISVVGNHFFPNVWATEYDARTRPPALPSAQRHDEISVSQDLGSATGLAWQPIGKAPGRGMLWVAYQEAKRLVSVPLSSIPTPTTYEPDDDERFVPRFLSFDYANKDGWGPAEIKYRLWSIDQTRQGIARGASSAIQPGDQPRFKVEKPLTLSDRYEHLSDIRGFALDPKRDLNLHQDVFITCRGGGLCSRIEVRRSSTDQIYRSFFPRCIPIDVAIDPQGESLWILADNGDDKPAVILERPLADVEIDSERTDEEKYLLRIRSAAKPSRRAMNVETPGRPVAIAATGHSIWILSNRRADPTKKKNARPLIESFVTEFRVRTGP